MYYKRLLFLSGDGLTNSDENAIKVYEISFYLLFYGEKFLLASALVLSFIFRNDKIHI